MSARADRSDHAVGCRCPRCQRRARLFAARWAIGLSMLGFVGGILFLSLLLRKVL